MRRPTESQRPRRTGLTLIELLVVIIIIGILMGILIPAVGGALRAGKRAQVVAEINNMSTALADFKNQFGDYPPSRLYCAEDGDYTPPKTAFSGMTLAESQRLAQRSLTYFRKFWPRFQLSTTGALYTATTGFADFNGDATLNSHYVLQGPECLVFFLGGVPKKVNGQFSMTGFGKNPTNPFLVRTVTGSDNRVLPLYEFASGRLDDSEIDPVFGAVNGFPCYLDTLGGRADALGMDVIDKRPFVYFASYGDSGYDPNDYNAAYEFDSSSTLIGRQFSVSFQSGLLSSVGPNPYTASGPVVYASGSTTMYTSATFQNANTFQILSSGIDRQWGVGGQYTGGTSPGAPFNAGTSGPFYDKTTFVTPGDTGNPRIRESDNITNFSGGTIN